jgi:hypothetical protein
VSTYEREAKGFVRKLKRPGEQSRGMGKRPRQRSRKGAKGPEEMSWEDNGGRALWWKDSIHKGPMWGSTGTLESCREPTVVQTGRSSHIKEGESWKYLSTLGWGLLLTMRMEGRHQKCQAEVCLPSASRNNFCGCNESSCTEKVGNLLLGYRGAMQISEEMAQPEVGGM